MLHHFFPKQRVPKDSVPPLTILYIVSLKGDPDAAAKDHFIARQLAANVEVAPLAQRIKAFVRSEGQQLPRTEGYP